MGNTQLIFKRLILFHNLAKSCQPEAQSTARHTWSAHTTQSPCFTLARVDNAAQ